MFFGKQTTLVEITEALDKCVETMDTISTGLDITIQKTFLK